MYIPKKLVKLAAAFSAAVMLLTCVTMGPIVQAASAQQGKFNMSYLFFGDPSSYISQVNKSGKTLDTVSPDFFQLDADGNLQLSSSLLASFVNEMHQQGKKVVPFLSNDFDEKVGEKALDNRETLVNQIAEAVKANQLDGVQIDIENVSASYRDKFTDLVKTLRQTLPSTMEVSVAVPANPTGSSKGWIGAYDYKELAAVSDYLMLMAYDESSPGDPTPGPVASLPFVEKSIRYALTQVSPDKIVLGVPFYGRYWNQDPKADGSGVSLQTLDKLLQIYKAKTGYDGASQSPYASFTVNPTDAETLINGQKLGIGAYTVWYENEQSLKAKLKLVGKYNLRGSGSWSLSQELPGTWDYYGLWADGFYFTDVQKHWARSDVFEAAKRGWMTGVAQDQFEPDADLTRAQAAAIMVRVLGLSGEAPTTNAAGFSDVPASYWAGQDILLAKQHGLIEGVSDNLFAPDQVITREQMAALITRALQLQTSNKAVNFSDVPEGSWSAGAIAAINSNGLVNGYADGTFRPQSSLTRAEMAALLDRMAPLLAK